MTIKRLSFLALLAFLVISPSLYAQRLKSMEFRNQPITDILMALAAATGTSIIPDETVSGNASFYFSESDFEEALSLFLSTYRLHYVREGGVFRVSRIAIDFDKGANLVSLSAEDTDVESLLRALSKAISQTILYDQLPKVSVSVAIDRLPPEKAIDIITRRLAEFTLEQNDSFYYVKRLAGDLQGKRGGANSGIVKSGDRYSLSVEKARFTDLIEDLFKKAGLEYSLLVKSDAVLENLYFSDRDFEGLLRLILEQGNADFVLRDGVYYILELQRRDVVKKLKETRQITLNYMSAQDLPNLLPSELASGNAIKIDKNTNTVFLTGSDEESAPIVDFIKLVDRPLDGLRYERFDVLYLKVKDLIAIIPPKLIPITPLVVPESNSFVVLGTPACISALRDYLATVDRKAAGYPVKLRYLKTDEFLKALPPSISKDDVVDSGYPNLVFFVGSEDKRKLFLRELESIDRPKPQIRYELLVIQYNKTKQKKISNEHSVSTSSEPDTASLVSNLGNLFSMNIDVISEFGYQFAAKLSAALTDNVAQVFADTTLNGLSGQEIKFQNTDTSRYPSLEYDESSGKYTATGATKEITSGLIVSINGWVSGDDMITITVNATVSKQNSSASTSSSDNNALPSTSERVVTTQVRTPSGKAIVISGLIKEDTDKTINKTPLLGSIPLIGLLFRSEDNTKSKSEIVIYIVPHIAYDVSDETTTERLGRYYDAFVRGSL